jgi:V-containing nitrogenase delta subunit
VTTQTKELVNFIQERCLWQFYSRAWDREENINGVLGQLGELLSNQTPKLETPMDRCHFANANHLAREVRSAFPWLEEMSPDSLTKLIGGVMAKLEEITITKSKNGELHTQAY